MATVQRRAQVDALRWVQYGAIGGVIAGIVFAMFEMIVAAIMNGGNAFFMPLRMIGATVLGMKALDPGYSLLTAGVVGLMVHMVLSVLFGVILAFAFAAIPALASGTTMRLAAASIYGFGLWIVNFYVIARAADWSWFPNGTNAVVQFIAHTVMFGTVLGIALDRLIARDERAA